MRYFKPQAGTLYCFSPPIMIATFAIEISLAVYTLVRYRLTPVTRLAAAILVCLALFQLAEYNICEGAFGLDGASWTRVGFVAITMLPPLGIHLAARLAGDKQPILVGFGYVAAALFAGYFLFSSQGVSGPACMGNYVIFDVASGASGLYTAYYYGLLLIGVMYSWRVSHQLQKNENHKARALNAFALGYVAFMVPTTLVNIVDPSTISAIPSIMCGFAVILAVVLSGEVLPRYFKHDTLSASARKLVPSHHKLQ